MKNRVRRSAVLFLSIMLTVALLAGISPASSAAPLQLGTFEMDRAVPAIAEKAGELGAVDAVQQAGEEVPLKDRLLKDELLKEAERVAAEGFDRAAFERAKRASLGARLRGFEDFDSVCLSSFDGARFGYSVFDAPAVLASVTEEECRAFLARVLTRERTALSVIKPGRS